MIECRTSQGIYVKEKYHPIVTQILNWIIEIIKGFESDKAKSIRADLENSLDRLLTFLQENFKHLLPNLIDTVLSLIKLRAQISISSSPLEQLDVKKIFNENEEEGENLKGKEIQYSEIKGLNSSLSLLNIIFESIGDDFLPYVDKVEAELIQLNTYKSDQKIRIKCLKSFLIF